MKLKLHVWRQKDKSTPGRMETYDANNISPNMSFLEMLDVVNEDLIKDGKDPIAFEHDCREGICGSCGLMVNGVAHGPQDATTTCQLHMRSFKDGEELFVEPWRAHGFPVLRDLVVDRSAFDRIIQAGGFISVNSGAAQDANALPVRKVDADEAFNAAACIGCGACVAACKNASAMLFVSAKVAQFSLLPQGQPERQERALNMVNQMKEEGFGNCTNQYECEAVCPKQISADYIAKLNREFIKASLSSHDARK
ncbi:succinate dehydrogenase/fumarate reductase iron-sulfur subunit [bacterium]|nr:succinate dehydrogenase/fumarate reductase iron-sulfur subunit [bacterium]